MQKYRAIIQVDEEELRKVYSEEEDTPLESVIEIEFGWLAGIRVVEMEELNVDTG